jgi:hypothetical protein
LGCVEIKDKSSVVVNPGEAHWGTSWFIVRDHDGNQIAFFEDVDSERLRKAVSGSGK